MERYLCYQIQVVEQESIGQNHNVEVNVIIRNVGAKSNEEAIGKFILNTAEIKAQKKLQPICLPLITLAKID